MAKQRTRIDVVDRARKKALQLLRVKLRSTAELRGRLAAAGFGEGEIEVVVRELKQAKVLDDTALAQAEVRRRLERGPMSDALVRAALAKRGLDASGSLGKIGSSRSDAIAFARKKLAGMPTKLSVEAKARRLFGLLARRGFAEDMVREIVVRLTGAPSES